MNSCFFSIRILCATLTFLGSLITLSSCATMYDGPMAEMVIRGAINNDLRMVMRNVTPRNVQVRDSRQSEEPIYYAVRHGNREMINLLHNNGASLNYQTRRGHSLAYVAASHGHDDLARTLARHGGGTVADINAAVKQRNQQIAYNKKKAADDRKMTTINNKKRILVIAMIYIIKILWRQRYGI